jgi:hypothetical protein
MSKIDPSHRLLPISMTNKPIIFITIPLTSLSENVANSTMVILKITKMQTISVIFNFPLAKTIALFGAATGKQN